ncbi:MAG TPA: hypothetical protein VK928_10350 [Longimicrobiales bacterium]|nr:hypothetical protein [Longimicrobiales bacterium]
MVAVTSLFLPIVLSAVFVFIASSLIHMLLGYHAGDFSRTPDEEAVRATLRIPPGDYSVPFCSSMAEMKTEEFKQKMADGPIAWITVAKPGTSFMGASMAMWFVYCLVVSLFAAYVAAAALDTGAHYLEVFRFAGTVAFAGYGLGIWQQTIWYKRSVSSTLKSTFDALVYALLTAGTLGWLWPS